MGTVLCATVTRNPSYIKQADKCRTGSSTFSSQLEFDSDVEFIPTKTYQKKILQSETFESKERTDMPTERDFWVLRVNC